MCNINFLSDDYDDNDNDDDDDDDNKGKDNHKKKPTTKVTRTKKTTAKLLLPAHFERLSSRVELNSTKCAPIILRNFKF